MKKAQDLMTAKPSTCREDHSAYDAVKVMEQVDCGSVPVVDKEGRPAGMITDRDVCLRVVLEGKDPRSVKLSQIMTPHPAVCSVDDDLESVLRVMEERQVRRIPVVDGRGKLAGIIAQADIAKQVDDEEKVSEMLELISR